MPRLTSVLSFTATLVSLSIPSLVHAQAADASGPPSAPSAAAGDVIVAHAADLAWNAGPASLPPGASFVIIEGDLTKAEPITLRLQFPPSYRIPPHFHSVIEHVTILSGTLHVGMGEKADYRDGVALPAGSFAAMPAKMVHFAWTGPDGVTFQLHSVGPWSITYVDPSDDPRNQE